MKGLRKNRGERKRRWRPGERKRVDPSWRALNITLDDKERGENVQKDEERRWVKKPISHGKTNMHRAEEKKNYLKKRS